jgi:hypothetical protein
MEKGTTFVALDDSKRRVGVAMLRPGASEGAVRRVCHDCSE